MSFYEKVVQHNDVLSLVSTPEHDSIGTTSSPKQGTSFSWRLVLIGYYLVLSHELCLILLFLEFILLKCSWFTMSC